MMRRFGALCAAGVLAAVVWASDPASAATVTHGAGAATLTYQGGPGETNQMVVTSAPGAILLTETGPATLGSVGDCDALSVDSVTCPSASIAQLDIDGGDGDDQITNLTGLGGVIVGGAGADVLRGGPAVERLDGGPGPDAIDGGAGNDEIYGATLQDPEAGVDGDTLAGGLGDDTLVGGGGADAVDGGPGDDRVNGGGGADDLRAGDGADTVIGGAGDDVEDGGAGNDQVGTDATVGITQTSQELGDDVLLGGPGDDTLAPGPGAAVGDADTISGGDGTDTVSYAARMLPLILSKDGAADDGDVGERDNIGLDVEGVTGGQADDRLQGSALPEALDGGPGDDTIDGLAGHDDLSGDGGVAAGGTDDIAGGPGNDRVEGDAGSDHVSGNDGNDALLGGDGDDTLNPGPGSDEVAGGPGRDLASYTTTWPVTVDLADNTAGNASFGDRDRLVQVEDVDGGGRGDTVTGTGGRNVLAGGVGADYVDGLRGVDRLDGGKGADVVVGRDGARDETVSCGPGQDFAIVDRRDRVVRRGVNRCEQVDDGRTRTPRPGRVVVVPQRCPAEGESVGLSLPAMGRWVPLRSAIAVPTGYGRRRSPSLDTADCTARISATPGEGRRAASADVSGDPLSIRQSTGRATTTALTLSSPGCGRAARRLARAPRSRRVRVRTRRRPGRWQVRGSNSIGAAQGTDWTTVETCTGTRTIVRSGRVRVFDRGRRRTVVVRAGHSYLARARSR